MVGVVIRACTGSQTSQSSKSDHMSQNNAVGLEIETSGLEFDTVRRVSNTDPMSRNVCAHRMVRLFFRVYTHGACEEAG